MAIRITQAGVALTVGIIIVTGLIVGGFFLVKNSGEQARRDEAIKIAQQNLEDRSGDDVAITTEDPDKTSEETKSNDEEVKMDKSTSTESNSSSDTVTETPVETASELPRTGAQDTGALVVVGIITYAALAYIQSRQKLLGNV